MGGPTTIDQWFRDLGLAANIETERLPDQTFVYAVPPPSVDPEPAAVDPRKPARPVKLGSAVDGLNGLLARVGVKVGRRGVEVLGATVPWWAVGVGVWFVWSRVKR